MANLVIAHLIPVNSLSVDTLSAAIQEIQNEKDLRQLRFFEPTSLGNSTTPTPADPRVILSLEKSRLPEYPNIGWRVGHDARRVDIRLATLSSQQDFGVNEVKFRLFIHRYSGLLVLAAGAEEPCIRYQDFDGQIKNLAANGQLVLFQQVTHLTFTDGREFLIRYAASSPIFPLLQSFVRETYYTLLHQEGERNLTGGLSARRGQYILGDIIGVGSYGDVYYAVNVRTGDPVALKDVRIINRSWRKEILDEIDIMTKLKDLPHILQVIDTWCSDHNTHPSKCKSRGKMHFFMAQELAIYDFSHKKFSDLPSSTALVLLRQILDAVGNLHQNGLMHRDVTLKNMLVLTDDPPSAALCDFGKAVASLHSRQTEIGPVCYCAPEVWANDKGYTQSIDLWFWAYAVALYLGWRVSNEMLDAHISIKTLDRLRKFLSQRGKEEPELALLTDLCLMILIWDPQERVTVDQALNHAVWKACASVEEDLEGKEELHQPAVKRFKLDTFKNPEPLDQSDLRRGSRNAIKSLEATVAFDDEFYEKAD